MKAKSVGFISIGLLIAFITFGAVAPTEFDPVGKWKFSAPDAPYPYGTGSLVVKLDGEDLRVTLAFQDVAYQFPGESVEFEEDVLAFNIYLDGEDIFLSMKFVDEDKLSGRAIYSEGAIPLTASRVKE